MSGTSTTNVISSISAGVQTQYGATAVEGVAGIRPPGIRSRTQSPTFLVFDAARSFIQLDLGTLPGWLGRFDFTTPVRPVSGQGLDSQRIGVPGVANAAQGFWPRGVLSQQLGDLVAAFEAVREYALAAPGHPYIALNFAFGTAPVFAVHGFDSFTTGMADVEQPPSIIPAGIPPVQVGRPRVGYRQAAVVLDLVALAERQLALQFQFGGHQMVVWQGLDAFTPGDTTVANDAQSFTPVGRDPDRIPPALVYIHPNRQHLFNLRSTSDTNAANIPFNFGEARNMRPVGWEVSAVGQPSITSVVYAQGQDSAAFGEFITSYEGQVVVVGWDSSAFGALYVPVAMDGLDSAAFGAAELQNLRRYVAPAGRASTAAFGALEVFSPLQEVFFEGAEHTEFGDFIGSTQIFEAYSLAFTVFGKPTLRTPNQILVHGASSLRIGHVYVPPREILPTGTHPTANCWDREDIENPPHRMTDEELDAWTQLAWSGYPDGEGLRNVFWVTNDEASDRFLCLATGYHGRAIFESTDDGLTWGQISPIGEDVYLGNYDFYKSLFMFWSMYDPADADCVCRLNTMRDYTRWAVPLVVGDVIVQRHAVKDSNYDMDQIHHAGYCARIYNARTLEVYGDEFGDYTNTLSGTLSDCNFVYAYHPDDEALYRFKYVRRGSQTAVQRFDAGVWTNIPIREDWLSHLARPQADLRLSRHYVYQDGYFFLEGEGVEGGSVYVYTSMIKIAGGEASAMRGAEVVPTPRYEPDGDVSHPLHWRAWLYLRQAGGRVYTRNRFNTHYFDAATEMFRPVAPDAQTWEEQQAYQNSQIGRAMIPVTARTGVTVLDAYVEYRAARTVYEESQIYWREQVCSAEDCSIPGRVTARRNAFTTPYLVQDVFRLRQPRSGGWTSVGIPMSASPILPRYMATNGRAAIIIGRNNLRRKPIPTDEPWNTLARPQDDPGNGNVPMEFLLYRFDWRCLAAKAAELADLFRIDIENEDPATEWGTSSVTHGIRYVQNVGGRNMPVYGEPWVSFYTRYVQIHQAEASFKSHPFLVGSHQDVLMVTPNAMTQWGAFDVDYRRLLPAGFESFVSPAFRASRTPLVVRPFSWDPRAFGSAFVWLFQQFAHFEEPDTDPDTYRGVVFGRGEHFKVWNYDRVIRADGWLSFRTAATFADVTNTARAVLVQGLDSYGTQPWYRQHLVAFSERALDMPGLDSFRMVRTHMVYNGARVLAFEGADSGVFGFGRAWRYLQTVRMSSVRYDSQGLREFRYGLPWVAPAVRGFQMRSPRQSLQMPHIIVGHTPLRVHMEGLFSFRFTNLYTIGLPIPTITPRWLPVDYWDLRLIGIPRVWNVTPQIYPFGRNMLRTEARHMVAFRVRDVAPEGFDSFRFENLFTMFRDRAVWMDGKPSSRVSPEFDVFREGPDLPSQRTIAVGIPPSGNQSGLIGFGAFRMSIVAIVFTARDSDDLGPIRFGDWQVFGHSVVFRRTDFPPQYMFESGEFAISGGERRIEMSSEANELAQPSKARISPHTIWMKPATQQARQNHRESDAYCKVDAFCSRQQRQWAERNGFTGPSTYPWWGRAWVYSPGAMRVVQMRSTNLQPSQRIGARIGDLEVAGYIRSIAPTSWLSFLQGYPRVTTPQDQTVDMWSGGDYFDPVWGVPVVTDNGPQHVVHGGSFFGAIGSHEVQNQHRPVYMAGADFTVWGDNTPLIYHYPRGFTPVDSDLTQWGDAWFSHSPRWLAMEGTLFFRNGWAWPDFDARMTVWNQLGIVHPHAGFDASRYGAFEVESGDAMIRPYGFVRRCATGQHEVRHV